MLDCRAWWQSQNGFLQVLRRLHKMALHLSFITIYTSIIIYLYMTLHLSSICKWHYKTRPVSVWSLTTEVLFVRFQLQKTFIITEIIVRTLYVYHYGEENKQIKKYIKKLQMTDDRAWNGMDRLQKGIWHAPHIWLKNCMLMFSVGENM